MLGIFSMSISSFLFLVLLVGSSLMDAVRARPSTPVGYFPDQFHPWSISDDPDDILPYDSILEGLNDKASARRELRIPLPVYTKVQGGFVPPELTSLDKVYWWNKRFSDFDNLSPDDIPYVENDDENNDIITGGVKKRDYTA
ncbi:hypothetical protein X975_14776, partial [Stegodyphus mimosarum]